jgi:hypothetical protein
VRRWLLRLRFEEKYRSGRDRVPLKVVADLAGLNRDTLYEAQKGGKISERTRSLLSWIIIAVDGRRLTFSRRGQLWHFDYCQSPSGMVTANAPGFQKNGWPTRRLCARQKTGHQS